MYYGIDMGASNMVWAVFNEQGQEVMRDVQPTPNHDYQALRRLIKGWVRAADQHWQITGRLGIGFAGVLQENGQVVAINLLSIHGQFLAHDLAIDLQRPVAIDNDANCFLLSEANGGAAAQAKLALGITLGTGVGGAITYQGQLVNSQAGGVVSLAMPLLMPLSGRALLTYLYLLVVVGN
ncbi:hypothetical protein CBP12_04890 [Oceanisphaera avium]|uniref:N-acetylglucosamine kinase n=1 Tax=Oceanisphaera avium TaxID=1903694 RepID=A0A1Y0CWF0_9GAMM|nr:ROK family protein [Oceanisphaera avium]ART79569.1 hypothetical protein CBP12_04890 [Oceanisphaera avium]